MNKKRLFLHVGRHKSGTSAIQHCLNAHGETLAEQGVCYPQAGREDHSGGRKVAHHPLADMLNGPTSHGDFLAETKKRLNEEVEGFDTAIISSEAFQNVTDLSRLVDFFDGFSDYDLTIIVYFREYLSYCVSAFQQFAQNQQRFLTFDAFSRRDFGVADFIERWSALGETVFRPFDKKRLLHGDVVDDFLALVGIEIPFRQPATVNHSIGGNLLFARLLETSCGTRLTTYNRAAGLAKDHQHFREAFQITDERAEEIRGANDYNAIVENVVGPLAKRSFAQLPELPDIDRLKADFGVIYDDTHRAEMLALALDRAGEAKTWFE